jgi:hypothetical protein
LKRYKQMRNCLGRGFLKKQGVTCGLD